MTGVFFDVRDALRSLRHDRAYAATAVLTLALTLGATTAVFSIVNGVLLEPLAYRESHRLVAIEEVWREVADRFPVVPVNENHLEYWRTHARSFASMAQYLTLPANLTGTGDATQVNVVHATGTIFDVLQIPAALGRTLTLDDDRGDRPQVVVVTDRLWRQRLGADRTVVGRTLVLDGQPYTIVGVLPPGVRLPERGELDADLDAFVPVRVDEDHVGWAGEHNFAAVGRLRDGVTIDAARAELDVLQAQVSAIATKEAHQGVTLGSAVTPLTETIVGHARRGLWLLLGAIVGVLLIACSNLANLALTRTVGGLRDAAVRAALGASRARLLSRVIIEQLAIACAGGAGGLLVAWGAIAAFVRTAPIDLPRAADVTVDGRVLGFAAAVTVAAGLLVAVVPAWHLVSADVHERLRGGGLATTDARGGLRTRSVLLALQVGLSVMLLVVTGLLTISFVRLVRSDVGFDPTHALALHIILPQNRYPRPEQRAEVADRVLERVRAIPGVVDDAWAHLLPLRGQGTVNSILREGDDRPWGVQPEANYRYVSADYFNTLAIPLRRGRLFADTDRDRATVPAIVTERTAARVWPGVDPIGQRFHWTPDRSEKLVEVVGVVADTKTNIDSAPPLMVYMPYWYRPRPSTSLVVRTASDPEAFAGAVRQAVRGVDPDIAIASVRPMDAIVDEALGGRRYQMRLLVMFGGVALLIAAIGVYGVTAYSVSRRRREMNIRVALGAPLSHVFGLVVRHGLSAIGIGLAAGAAGALAVGTLVGSLLFEVRARDPIVIAAVVAIVGGVGLAAASTAARNGLALDPAAALREE